MIESNDYKIEKKSLILIGKIKLGDVWLEMNEK